MSSDMQETTTEADQGVSDTWTVVPPGSPTIEDRLAAIEKWIDWRQRIDNRWVEGPNGDLVYV